MDAPFVPVQPGGGTRRELLKKGAAVAGAAVWAAPAVQVLTMTPATAQMASPTCTPSAAGSAHVLTISGLGASLPLLPSSTSDQPDAGTAGGDAGPEPISMSVGSVIIRATVVRARSHAHVLQAPATDAAQDVSSAQISDLQVQLPDGLLRIGALNTSALARVDRGVLAPTLTPLVEVLSVSFTPIVGAPLQPLGTSNTVTIPGGLGSISWGQVESVPGERTGALTVTGAVIRLTPTGVAPFEIVASRSWATASFPC